MNLRMPFVTALRIMRVSTSLDSSLSNIANATKESVDTIVKSLNDLLLNCAKKMQHAKN